MEKDTENSRLKMLNKIKNTFELIKISIVRFVIFILFRKKTRPPLLLFLLRKHIDIKLNMITPSEFEGWILSDAQGL